MPSINAGAGAWTHAGSHLQPARDMTFLLCLILALGLLIPLVWQRYLGRKVRVIRFGLSILTSGKSRLAAYLPPSVSMVMGAYPDGDRTWALRVHQPASAQGPLPAVILYHGTTPKGEAHETMNLLAADLARMGVRAFIPELPVLKQALVREETLPRIRRTFVQVASRPDVRADRIIMAGFSFAGGLVLKASTEPEVTPTAVLSYGSYFDLESSLRYFLSGYARFPGVTIRIRPHEYARAVFFWNFLDQMAVDLDTGSLRQCMNWFINDQQDRARSFARGLGAAEQRFAQSAFDPEDPEGIRMAEKIMPRIRGQLRSLSPKYFLDRITVPVFLVHGVNDTMVPYTETLAMAHALAQAGKPHDVYISGIYSHSEAEKRRAVALFREIRDLIRSLNKMLTYLF